MVHSTCAARASRRFNAAKPEEHRRSGERSTAGSVWMNPLDVLERYRPFLVSSRRLYEALDTVDRETGKKRGLLQVRKISDFAPENR